MDFALYESSKTLSLGVVQISHGMAEHIGRYEHFINYLNEEGFHVIIHNHRGHGDRLVDGRMGFFSSVISVLLLCVLLESIIFFVCTYDHLNNILHAFMHFIFLLDVFKMRNSRTLVNKVWIVN